MPNTTILGDGSNPSATPDNVIEALVGEGKTYKTVDDLAKGKLNADIHIQKIELENKELREKLAGAKTVDDLLEKITAKAVAQGDPNASVLPSGATNEGITADQVAKIVANTIQGHETTARKTANRVKAEAKLKEVFGDKAAEVFAKEATTPELKATLTQLAEIDPDKFVSLFVRTPAGSNIDNGSNGRNLQSVNLNPNPSAVEGTQAYYSELRRTKPSVYYSAAVQLEMHKAALNDPNKYFGRS